MKKQLYEELRETSSTYQNLLREQQEIRKVFIPWKHSYNTFIATNPNCKTETIRKHILKDTTQYPSDMREHYNRLQEIKVEIKILKNSIDLLKIAIGIADHD
jgi:hypothetical protein